MEKGLTHHI